VVGYRPLFPMVWVLACRVPSLVFLSPVLTVSHGGRDMISTEAEWQKSPYKKSTQEKEQLANTNSLQVVGKVKEMHCQ